MRLTTNLLTLLCLSLFSATGFALDAKRVSVVRTSLAFGVYDAIMVDGWGAIPGSETVADFFAGLKKDQVLECDVKFYKSGIGSEEQSHIVNTVYRVENCKEIR